MKCLYWVVERSQHARLFSIYFLKPQVLLRKTGYNVSNQDDPS